MKHEGVKWYILIHFLNYLINLKGDLMFDLINDAFSLDSEEKTDLLYFARIVDF